MANGAYLALGALGGVGTGMVANANMKLDEYKRQTDFARQKSLVDLRHQYGVEDTKNAREHEAGLLEDKNTREDNLLKDKNKRSDSLIADERVNAAAVLETANTRKDNEVFKYVLKDGVKVAVNKQGQELPDAEVDSRESPKYNASRIKATKDLVESVFIQDFLDERRQLPEEERSMTEFTLDDPLNPDKKYKIDKMMGLASPALRTKYKVLSQLSEKYAHNGELPPEQAFAMAKSEYEARLNDQQIADREKATKKVIEDAAKELGETVEDIEGLINLKPTDQVVQTIYQDLGSTPGKYEKFIKHLKTLNPELYEALKKIKGVSISNSSSPSVMSGANSSSPSVMSGINIPVPQYQESGLLGDYTQELGN